VIYWLCNHSLGFNAVTFMSLNFIEMSIIEITRKLSTNEQIRDLIKMKKKLDDGKIQKLFYYFSGGFFFLSGGWE
jgi:hypothetical protein